MRVMFAGTPRFAARALEAILAAGHEVPLVLTQPDRPAGRHQRPTLSAVAMLARERSLPLHQPERLRSEQERAPVLSLAADVMVVAAYGLILPRAILDHPRHGCLNIHASLLPRWRGAAPIQRAILAGDTQPGVSIRHMDAGLDAGAVVSTHAVAIAADDTAGTLLDKLAETGAREAVVALATLEREGALRATPQPETGVTYAAKIDKAEARLDWNDDAVAIERRIRAFNPAPGASTTVDGMLLKLWRAHALADERIAGAIVDRPAGSCIEDAAGVIVRCGEGVLALDEVQPAGGRRMSATEYLKGRTSRGNVRMGT